MFEEGKKVGIPESVTIGGVTYVVKDTPELQQFIQEVAKVEKSKLYTQFENLKTQIANLGRTKVTEGLDIDNIVEKLKDTFVTKETLQEVLPNTIKEVIQPVLVATEQNRKNELQEYREKLINENIATCIPELVKGESKEELDASLKESIRLRSAYPTPSTANIDPTIHVVDPLLKQQAEKMGGDTEHKPAAPAAPSVPAAPVSQAPILPSAPRRHSPDVSEPKNVKQMPMGEFEKQRENLRQQLEALYGNGTL